MVEMMVAITIIATGLIGMLGLINRSLGIQRVTAEQYTATYLAAEGIEIMKNFFDRSYIIAQTDAPGSDNFYGSTPPTGLSTEDFIEPGIYELDYNSDIFPQGNNALSCGLVGGEPNQSALESLFENCSTARFLNFNSATGIFSYDGSPEPSKFRRLIIVDEPQEYNNVGAGLNFRITSAVEWSSRGGTFIVNLEDHFLPYRKP